MYFDTAKIRSIFEQGDVTDRAYRRQVIAEHFPDWDKGDVQAQLFNELLLRIPPLGKQIKIERTLVSIAKRRDGTLTNLRWWDMFPERHRALQGRLERHGRIITCIFYWRRSQRGLSRHDDDLDLRNGYVTESGNNGTRSVSIEALEYHAMARLFIHWLEGKA